MATKDKKFDLNIKFNGPMNLKKICDFLIDTMKGHGFKVIEDSFEKKGKEANKFDYKIKYFGSKDDKPWTNYEYEFEIKVKGYDSSVDLGKGELELLGELKIDYTNPYKSKNFILKQINSVDSSIYKEKEKYLEDIYKEIEEGIRSELDNEYL